MMLHINSSLFIIALLGCCNQIKEVDSNFIVKIELKAGLDEFELLKFKKIEVDTNTNEYYINSIPLFSQQNLRNKIILDTTMKNIVTGNNYVLFFDKKYGNEIVEYKLINLGIDDEISVLADRIIFNRKEKYIKLISFYEGEHEFRLIVSESKIVKTK